MTRGVICYSTADWDSPLWTNKQHLMMRIGRSGVPVLYVDSLGLRSPSLGRADAARMAKRLWRWRPHAKPAAPNVWRDAPLVIPLHRYRAVQHTNRTLLKQRLHRNERRLAISDAVVWAYTPSALDAFVPGHHRALVYHCVDDLAAYPGIDAASFRAREAELVKRADVCLASSRPLMSHLRNQGAREVLYWPNPADTVAFSSVERRPRPEGRRPVVGFVGAVQEHKIDLELVRALAASRPDWRLALVGPVGLGLATSRVASTDLPPNVELWGLRQREDLPAVLAEFDIGIIPYALNDYTSGVFPMKVFEYLASGLPVVSTPLPSLVEEVSHIRFARDAAGFASAIEAELSASEPPGERQQYAAQFSWDRRTEEALSLLRRLAP